MADTTQVTEQRPTEKTSNEQPIAIRKLDRLETTSHTTPGN